MHADITTNIEPLFKQWYSDTYETLFYRNHPAHGLIAKEHAEGEQVKQPIKIAPGAGTSAAYATAYANASSSVRRGFLGDWYEDHSVATIKKTPIELSGSNKGAVLKLFTDEVESEVTALGNRLEADLFRSGYGELGIVSSGQGTPTITLTARADTQKFFVGQVVVASSSLSGAALRNSGASIVVTGVDRDAGTVTAGGNWTASIAALAAGDYLFQQGDRQDAASPAALKVVGFAGWLPLTAPGGSDSFMGVNRSIDTTALAGVRTDGRGAPVTQAMFELAVRIAENGGTPDTAFVSYDTFLKLGNEFGNKVNWTDVKGEGISYGFRAIEIVGPGGPINVLSSSFCPTDRLYVLTKRDWTVYCGHGSQPMFANNDGQYIERFDADSVVVRHKTLAQLMCAAPGRSGVSRLA